MKRQVELIFKDYKNYLDLKREILNIKLKIVINDQT